MRYNDNRSYIYVHIWNKNSVIGFRIIIEGVFMIPETHLEGHSSLEIMLLYFLLLGQLLIGD
jgi:hypothetical protein